MVLQIQVLLLLTSIVFSSRSGAGNPTTTGQQFWTPWGSSSCPTFWTPWKNNCYRYFGAEVSWYDALNTCRMFSTEENLRGFADLVSIHSQDEHDFVYHYWKSLRETDTRRNKPGMWIGLNDIDQNGAHTWTDHSVVNYTNFDGGEKANEGSHFYFLWDWKDSTEQPNGKWHDIADRPEWHFKFMCKMAARPSSEP